MQQRFTVISIGAEDLRFMRKFYEEKLGWKTVAANKDIAFYQMNGFLFSICKRVDLAALAGVSAEKKGFSGVTFSYNVTSAEEVRSLYHQLKEKEVKLLTKPTEPPFGGLYFYFEDVEGNVLEIAYNDFIPMSEELHAIGHRPIDQL